MDRNKHVVERARDFAIVAHGDQRYNDLPYEYHLAAVAAVLADFAQDSDVLAAGWLHDVIEDTPITPAIIQAEFGPTVTDLVWACTGEGATRPERNASIYRKIAAYPRAAIVKVADRTANVEAAPEGSSHMVRYRREQDAFAAAVRTHAPAAMWSRLEAALRP